MAKISDQAPDFLAIGPPKTATSWLYSALKVHPEVSLPPMKEIGFLWEKNFLGSTTYRAQFSNSHWFYASRRKYLKRSLMKTFLFQRNWKDILWDLKYLSAPHTFKWYRNLFCENLVSGDITPKYCELSESSIEEIKAILGEKKIIITVRDPIEREWSRAKMNLCKKRGRSIDHVAETEWFKHFDDPDQSMANDYSNLFQRWVSIFDEENVLLLFHDEIEEDSWKAYHRTCDFLKIGRLPEEAKDKVLQRSNVGIPDPIPEKYRAFLYKKHHEKMKRFAKDFDHIDYPKNWIARYKDLEENI